MPSWTKMALLGVLFLAGLICSGAAVPARVNGDPLALIKEAIYEANQKTEKDGKSTVDIPEYKLDYYIGSVTGKNGKVGGLNTLALVGDQQTLNQNDTDDSSVLSFDLKVGLENITIHYEYQWTFLKFIRGSGKVEVKVTGDAVSTTGSITSNNDMTCTGVVKSAKLASLGDIQVSSDHWLLQTLGRFSVKWILPRFTSFINVNIAKILEDADVQKMASERLCEPFPHL